MIKILIKIFFLVILPLTLGSGVYLFEPIFKNYIFIRNFLPDGLWAFSATSSLLIIWNNKLNFFWISTLFVSFMIFEILQYTEQLPGTFDINDIFIYLIFASFSLFLNKLFFVKRKQNLY